MAGREPQAGNHTHDPCRSCDPLAVRAVKYGLCVVLTVWGSLTPAGRKYQRS
jgi:hypothetical protein